MSQNTILQQLQHNGVAAQVLDADMLYGATYATTDHALLLYLRATEHELSASLDLATLLSTYMQAIPSAPVGLKWLLDTAHASDDARLAEIIARHHTLLQADACIYTDSLLLEGDGAPVLALGAKGLLRVELAVQTALEHRPVEYGGVVPNALWRLTWALASLKDAREEILLDGFYDPILPAGEDEISLLQTLTTTTWAERWRIQETLFGLQGPQFLYAHLLTPSCTIASISSANDSASDTPAIPTHAAARVDIQLVPEQDPQQCFALLQHHLQERGFQDVQAHLLAACRPVRTPLNHPFVQLVQQATGEVYGRAPVVLPLAAANRPLAPLKKALNIPLVLTQMGYDQMQNFKQIVAVMERMR